MPLAHRGLWAPDGPPENSLAAFAAARDAGVGVELDVHVTADGVPVVVHDADLRRVAGSPVDVRRVPRAALAEHALADGSAVPTLAEVLELLGDTPVMVEVKNLVRTTGRVEPPVAEVVLGHLDRGGRAYVASFHPGSLAWFRRHRPQVMRAQTAQPDFDQQVPRLVALALSRLWLTQRSLPHLLSLSLAGLHSPVSTRWRDRGGVVVGWTVRTPDQLADASELADNHVFEHLDPTVV